MSTPATPSPSLADKILALLDAILSSTEYLIPYGELADFLLKVVQKGVAAYETHTGQPIDPSLIKPIEPIP